MAEFSKWIDAAPDDGLVDVARVSLRSRLEPIVHYVPLAAKGTVQDIEYVHQMRVWSRRTAAAIKLYRGLLPKRRRKWLSSTLKEIRDCASDARDDDVFAARLEQEADPRAARVLDTVRSHRSAAQRPINRLGAALLREHRFQRRVEKLIDKVRIRDGVESEPPHHFHAWAVPQLAAQVDAFFRAAEGDFSQYSELHRFRIAGKQMRYAVELLASAFDSSLRKETYPRIQDLQDRLGEINDHASAVQRLEGWIEQAEAEPQREFLRELRQAESERMAEQRDAFLDWWNGSIIDCLRGEFNVHLER